MLLDVNECPSEKVKIDPNQHLILIRSGIDIIIPHIIKNQFYWLKDNHMT